jgi:hypothetical protein
VRGWRLATNYLVIDFIYNRQMVKEMFFKKNQHDDIFLFAKVMENNLLRASETVNCLNKIPNTEHRDYYDTPADRIDYQAFFEN